MSTITDPTRAAAIEDECASLDTADEPMCWAERERDVLFALLFDLDRDPPAAQEEPALRSKREAKRFPYRMTTNRSRRNAAPSRH